MSGTQEDYKRLSSELREKSFTEPDEMYRRLSKNQDTAVTLSTNQPNLFEVSASVSSAASRIGKKFSFTVRREKVV